MIIICCQLSLTSLGGHGVQMTRPAPRCPYFPPKDDTHLHKEDERAPAGSIVLPCGFRNCSFSTNQPNLFPILPTCYSLNPGPHGLVKLSILTFFLTRDLTNSCHWRSGVFPLWPFSPTSFLVASTGMR